MRAYQAEQSAIGHDIALHTWLPESFVYTPGRPEDSDSLQRLQESAESAEKLWILKPSDGGKGSNILIMRSVPEIDAFLEERPKGSISWVVSEYLARPLLLEGNRKFDVRCWVLVDAFFNAYMYREGVLRTCSAPFTLDPNADCDPFVHLSNHCVQTQAPMYGQYEATNEMWFDEFAAWLAREKSLDFEATVRPQLHAIIGHTLRAARPLIEVDYERDQSHRAFQVFGLDFLIDSECNCWLLEVNSSPAIADHLAERFARDLKAVAVDSYLGEVAGSSGGWDKIDLEPLPKAHYAKSTAAVPVSAIKC